MSNLPQNTSYGNGNTGASTPGAFAGSTSSSLAKRIAEGKAKIQSNFSQSTTKPAAPANASGALTQKDIIQGTISGSLPKLESKIGDAVDRIVDRPANVPLAGVAEKEQIKPFSRDTENWAKAGSTGKWSWSDPSDDLSLKILEAGKGAYIIDNKNPNSIIKSGRGTA